MLKRGAIGIDIGGTKTRAALFDDKFVVQSEDKIKTHAEKDLRFFKHNLKAMMSNLRLAAKEKNINVVATGAGCAGEIDRHTGTVINSSIPFLKGFELSAFLSKQLGVPSIIGNDVHLGLYGEHRLGAAVGLKHVLGVFFGTGLGGAMIINGELYYGASNQAGNIGHYLVAPIGPLTGSERDGILNDFVSCSALAGMAATLAALKKPPIFLKPPGPTSVRFAVVH